ncbi:MAG: S41 family peptidase [Pirellulaceae bacterium]
MIARTVVAKIRISFSHLGALRGAWVMACLAVVWGGDPGAARADVTPAGRMLRYPDVGKTHIAFSYANDLWLVPRGGGEAVPVTSPAGFEESPRFSPDGETLAFVGNYDGGRDIYTIPVKGGVPQRRTYHPADELLCDWMPDGAIMYSTNGFSGLARLLQLYCISEKDPLPTKLPVEYGTNGAISPDGEYLAFTPYNADARTWKRYRGGMASDIWLYHLKNQTAKQITDWEGTDSLPMWHAQTVYYLSDAGPEHRLNIWAYDTATGARRQVTDFSAYDVKWPSIGPGDHGQGEIVFQYASDLYLLDLETGKPQVVAVTIPGDRPQVMPRSVNAADFITSGDLSPAGERVVLEARGDIWSLPAKNGSPRNMTNSSGAAERMPSWSPNGRWIAYLSDLTGEYELYIKQSDGKGETRRLTNDGQSFRYSPTWSPDSKHILFTDKTGAIYLHTIEPAQTVLIDRDPWASRPTLSWSHDSTWIAYDKRADDKAGVSSIWLYELKTSNKQQITDGMFNDTCPTFDRKGEYLFFASNRFFGSPMYDDLGTTFIYGTSQVLVTLPLRNDVKNPLLPKSDEVAISDKPPEKKEEAKKEDAPKEEKKEEPPKEEPPKEEPPKEEPPKEEPPKEEPPKEEPPKEEPPKEEPPKEEPPAQPAGGEGQKRVETSPDDPSDKPPEEPPKQEPGAKPAEEPKPEAAKSDPQAAVAAAAAEAKPKEEPKSLQIDLEGIMLRAFRLPVKNGIFSQLCVNFQGHLLFARRGVQGADVPPAIMLFDMNDESKAEKPVFPGSMQYTISADGKKLLVVHGKQFLIMDASAGAKPTPIPTNGMTAVIHPREEWTQLFTDAWRIERDFFYDPHMHGVNWPAVRDQYAKMLADCASREDVAYVISEMISEMNVGHAYYRGGDFEKETRVGAGVLGCEFVRDAGAYKIGRFYEGAPGDIDARNPLRQAGIKEGEYLLAINRMPLAFERDPWAALQGLAGQIVVLTVSSQPQSGKEDRDVVVALLANDLELRYRQWIEHNRKYVADKTEGRVGYIYVPDTGTNGQNDLFRQFFSQINKEALIIDDRWNGGGQIPTRFIELLNRPVTNYWARRDGRDLTWPPDAHHGPKCMLINGLAGSGGDMFPALFRQAQLGKLIGKRTWGGLVGISGNPSLIDGGSVTAPTFAYYEQDGTWGIEGHGVDPDIDVVDDPAKLAQGVDPQLDVAIELMLNELKSTPYVAPQRPAYPDRSGFGIRPEDR